jgi:hypothetical protein
MLWSGLHRPPRFTRIIVLRRGATPLFRDLQGRFAGDPDTHLIWDRRVADRRAMVQPVVENRRRGERRFPLNIGILLTRGFLVARAVGFHAGAR